MRISTRIAVGLGGLVLVVLASAVYQLSVVQKLEGISRELAGTRLEASRTAIEVLQKVETVREFAAKTLLLGDADYAAEWSRAEELVGTALSGLASIPLGDEEGEARIGMQEAWTAWMEATAPFRPLEQAPGWAVAEALEALDAAEPALDDLLVATESLLAANEARVTAESALAGAAAERARWVAWMASGGTALAALLVGLALWASIHGPLRRLTLGTQELARGNFEHRIRDRSRSELGTLARDFNQMAARLGELEELKQDFVSHVSHELKGPLAAVQETILVLLEEIPGPLNEKQRSLLELSEGSSARLSRMISDLLEMSRLEAGATRYDPTPLRLAPLIDDLLQELGPLAEERVLTLTGPSGPEEGWLLGDGDRLREVVANLVGNALKFTRPGGTVSVELSVVDRAPPALPSRYRELPGRERGPYLLLEVLDEGPGIPMEHREGVFEKFHQVSLDGRKPGQGVGLGLAIARRIVEGHGGAIWVGTARTGGAAFQVLLPSCPSRWQEMEPGLLTASIPGASPPAPLDRLTGPGSRVPG